MPQIGASDGCGRDAVLLAVERWYDFPELGVIWEMSVKDAGIEEATHDAPTGHGGGAFLICRSPSNIGIAYRRKGT